MIPVNLYRFSVEKVVTGLSDRPQLFSWQSFGEAWHSCKVSVRGIKSNHFVIELDQNLLLRVKLKSCFADTIIYSYDAAICKRLNTRVLENIGKYIYFSRKLDTAVIRNPSSEFAA